MIGSVGLIDIVVFDYITFPIFTNTTGMTHFLDTYLLVWTRGLWLVSRIRTPDPLTGTVFFFLSSIIY